MDNAMTFHELLSRIIENWVGDSELECRDGYVRYGINWVEMSDGWKLRLYRMLNDADYTSLYRNHLIKLGFKFAQYAKKQRSGV